MNITEALLQNREKLDHYHQSALKQLQKNYEQRKYQWQESLDLAEKAAEILKEKFTASKVALFGSALDLETFTQWSDVDIVVWGLDPHLTLLAMEEIQNLSDEIEINLVDINTVKPEMYRRILANYKEI